MPPRGVVAELAAAHGWASVELVEAVLAGCDGHFKRADAALREMCGADAEMASLDTSIGEEAGAGAAPCPEAEARAPDSCDARVSQVRAARQMRAAQRRAQRFFREGAHADARGAALEAMEWAREVEAHGRAAAEAILVEKNRDHGSLWVIDLHGLHAQEAVEALASRLALLEEGCAAAVSAGGLSSGMADPAFRRRALTVIVGKGHHSSDGEAVLPRAVQNWLAGHEYRFTDLHGQIEVLLRQLGKGGAEVRKGPQ